MSKPLLLMDPHFRTRNELFSDAAFAQLEDMCRVSLSEGAPMPLERVDAEIKSASFYVAARPALAKDHISKSPHLRAVIEVSGAFHGELDYKACFDADIEVLSCAPGFRRAVAEMGLAMILSAGRGLVAEHEAFRSGSERWLDDRIESDFTLHGQRIGFVGYGNIAREMHRLLAPFEPKVSFFDPWVDGTDEAVKCPTLDAVFSENRVVVVTATPTAENRHAIGTPEISAMERGASLVLLGRAHVMDFDAALTAAALGHITFATDVFPSEPVAANHPMRTQKGVILSPHRAAAVPGGRQLIGDMILHDVAAIIEGRTDRMLLSADPTRVDAMVAAQKAIEEDGRLPGT